MEQLFETLKCPCCKKFLYEPVTLLCGHTFCKSCLSNLPNHKCTQCNFGVPDTFEPKISESIRRMLDQFKIVYDSELIELQFEELCSHTKYVDIFKRSETINDIIKKERHQLHIGFAENIYLLYNSAIIEPSDKSLSELGIDKNSVITIVRPIKPVRKCVKNYLIRYSGYCERLDLDVDVPIEDLHIIEQLKITYPVNKYTFSLNQHINGFYTNDLKCTLAEYGLDKENELTLHINGDEYRCDCDDSGLG